MWAILLLVVASKNECVLTPDFYAYRQDVGFIRGASYVAGFVGRPDNLLATPGVPRTAESGLKLDVHWTGSANRGDYVAVVSPENKGYRFVDSASVTTGNNTVQLKLPDESSHSETHA